MKLGKLGLVAFLVLLLSAWVGAASIAKALGWVVLASFLWGLLAWEKRRTF